MTVVEVTGRVDFSALVAARRRAPVHVRPLDSRRRRCHPRFTRRHRPVTRSRSTLLFDDEHLPGGEHDDHGPAPGTCQRPAQPGRQRLGRVLVVEDEQDVAELIRYNLAKEGYDVVLSANGADALRQAREHQPDVILLDIMVPQLNGWEVCRRLKQDPETRGIPVIMVTGRVEEGDKVLGFELGADDYVTKPFSPRELVARVRAVMRRGRAAEAREKKRHLKVGDLEIDRDRFEVRMKGRAVELTPKEFELLATLVGDAGPGVRARGAARPGLGPRRLRGAPHRGRPRGAPARQVHGRQARRSPASRRSAVSATASEDQTS